MCQDCPKIHPSGAAQVSEQYHTHIKEAIEVLENLSKKCIDLEDEYRIIGYFYHTTEYNTRETMAGMPHLADELIHLEDYFELADLAEYDLWGRRIDTAVKEASTLRADLQHIPRQATVEQLVHKFDQVIYPAVRKLINIVKSERVVLMQLATEVNHLRQISMDAEERLEYEDIFQPWWAIEYDLETGEMETENQGQEWDAFVKWVSCLPETRKAVEKGEHVDDIALHWLWREDDERPTRLLIFEDGKIC